MKKYLSKYIFIIIFVLTLFSIAMYKFDNLKIEECSFYFSIIFLLLSFFSKKDMSSMPFGSTRGLGTNGSANFLNSTNEKIAYNRANIENERLQRKYNDSFKLNKTSLLFLFLGLLFFLISIVSTYIIYYIPK